MPLLLRSRRGGFGVSTRTLSRHCPAHGPNVMSRCVRGCRVRGTRGGRGGLGRRCSRGRSRTGWSRCRLPRSTDQCVEEQVSDAAAARCGGDVDGVLDDAPVHRPGGGRRDRHPAEDLVAIDGDEPILGQLPVVECLPGRRFRLERRVPGGNALPVDRLDSWPVGGGHRPNGDRVSSVMGAGARPGCERRRRRAWAYVVGDQESGSGNDHCNTVPRGVAGRFRPGFISTTTSA